MQVVLNSKGKFEVKPVMDFEELNKLLPIPAFFAPNEIGEGFYKTCKYELIDGVLHATYERRNLERRWYYNPDVRRWHERNQPSD